jgi:hypothetical protein
VGAWTLFGFHEDGFTSGIRAAEKLGARIPFEIVDARYVRRKKVRGNGGEDHAVGVGEWLGRVVLVFIQWWIVFTSRSMSSKKGKIE